MTASRINEDIRGKDIIQADAAIIAGILILLTISSFSPFEFPNRSTFVSGGGLFTSYISTKFGNTVSDS